MNNVAFGHKDLDLVSLSYASLCRVLSASSKSKHVPRMKFRTMFRVYFTLHRFGHRFIV